MKVLLFLLASLTLALSCVDEKGRPVDYYLVYKIPKLENSPNELLRSGYGYAFLTGNTAKWQLANRSIGDVQSLVGATLDRVYRRDNESNMFFYNDQPPKSCAYQTWTG